MAQVNTEDSGGGGKHQKKRAKKSSTNIDMTPMVDLAFLLLTFFVMTSTFSKPKALEINYPVEDEKIEPDENIKVPNGVTFLLTEQDKVFYYSGEFHLQDGQSESTGESYAATTIEEIDWSDDGIRKLLLDRNVNVTEAYNKHYTQYKEGEIADTTFKRLVREEKGKLKSLTVLVKADSLATYKNVIDMIDELNIAMVGKYAVVDLLPQERNLMLVKMGKDPIPIEGEEEGEEQSQ